MLTRREENEGNCMQKVIEFGIIVQTSAIEQQCEVPAVVGFRRESQRQRGKDAAKRRGFVCRMAQIEDAKVAF